MNDRRDIEARQAMIAAGRPGPLELEETADLVLLAEVLADPSTWAEPRAALEDDVADAVAEAAPRGSAPTRRRRSFVFAVAAVAAAVVIASGIAFAVRSSDPEFDARLTATRLAPSAGASAAITRDDSGFRISLRAHGLPRLPRGGYYQAWLRNDAGTRVPIGTFSSSDAPVTLWSGVSPATFTTMTITIESVDDDQAPSRRVVVAGPVHRR